MVFFRRESTQAIKSRSKRLILHKEARNPSHLASHTGEGENAMDENIEYTEPLKGTLSETVQAKAGMS
ncbi:hypothetical protein J31TS6_13600 [Brevibacillus reuszeri]|nr:hypothetical protein J31TS6_13600 [Brevibacillus reuszeri]